MRRSSKTRWCSASLYAARAVMRSDLRSPSPLRPSLWKRPTHLATVRALRRKAPAAAFRLNPSFSTYNTSASRLQASIGHSDECPSGSSKESISSSQTDSSVPVRWTTVAYLHPQTRLFSHVSQKLRAAVLVVQSSQVCAVFRQCLRGYR